MGFLNKEERLVRLAKIIEKKFGAAGILSRLSEVLSLKCNPNSHTTFARTY